MGKMLKLKPDLSYISIILLAILTIPRVPIHDLRLIPFDSPAYIVLAVVPFLVWLLVAVFRRTTRPIYDFVVVGLVYGIFLGITHQILWDASWNGNAPKLGGNLANIDPLTETVIIRIVGFCSSMITGLLIGLFFGVISLFAKATRSRLKRTT